MTSDRDALLNAISLHPDEDTPRLMYADWLEENGEADRAEFIRIQCELAQLAEDDSGSQPVYEFLRDRDYVTRPAADWTKIDDGIHKRLALSIRAEDLAKRNLETWTPQLRKPNEVSWFRFGRGFPDMLRINRETKLKRLGRELREVIPPFTLSCQNFTAKFVEELSHAKLLDRIVGLNIAGSCAEGLREFGMRPESQNLRRLAVSSLHEGEMEPDLPATLARCRYFTGLRQLALMRTSLAVDSVLAFFGESRFQTLQHLYLHGDNWPPVVFRSLANAGYTQLRRLQLPQCGMTDDGAESLANCAAFANLQTLELEGNVIEGRGVSALLASPHLRNLAYLGVGYNPAHHLDAALLAQAEPGRLRMFHAHGSRLRTADVRALARCPRMRTLLYLDLDNNRLHTAGVRELVRGFGKWCPPILWLTYNNIDNRGAEILANWKAANMLRVLHLKHNYIMDSHAARTLLDSPNLQNLDSFAISVTDDETQNRIAARFPREVDY